MPYFLGYFVISRVLAGELHKCWYQSSEQQHSEQRQLQLKMCRSSLKQLFHQHLTLQVSEMLAAMQTYSSGRW